uniref:uncharacterized protein LOC113475733 n=1 Tax=Ciona intestinalis TaxID=7719 RepID=UPI000EF4EB1F|nr:uncharacterized protein LOC113475733 [Ciona intestinalis]|eukprot:XP_026696211.1 uncharacterized protein LOC113475733 [Ciona intestinalis]
MWLYTAKLYDQCSPYCVVWVRAKFSTTLQEKLRMCQRLACLKGTSCFRTAPTRALEALLNLNSSPASSSTRQRGLQIPLPEDAERCILSLHFDQSLQTVIEDRSTFKPPDPMYW